MSPLSDADIFKLRGITKGQVRQLTMRRGVSNETIAAMPDDVLKRTLGRLQYHDLPRARQAFRAAQSRSPTGQIPLYSMYHALRQNQALSRQTTGRVAGVPVGPQPARGAPPPPTAGLPPGHTGWLSLGPGNIGGRIRSIVTDPGNFNHLWAASVGGGVWETRDGGTTWLPVNDLLQNLAVSCMAMSPADPNTIYAGTGEGFFNIDAIRGAGIFMTTDATNWVQLAATVTPDFQSVNRIAVSADGAVVLAATETGILRSADAARAIWTNVQPGETAFVAFHPTDASRAIAGGLRNGIALFSSDGGQTWTAAQGGPWSGRVELTYAAQDPSIVYASVDVAGGQIWRSADGGQSYVQQTSQSASSGQPARYLGSQGWYGNVIWAGDPTNANLVIVGGVDLWRSTDGGNTLIDVSTWWDPRSAHADHHRIVAAAGYDGNTNKTVYFGNDGGVYMTADVTTVGDDAAVPRIAGWTRLDNSFGVTQFYSGAGNVGSGTIIGGAQDNGTLTFTPQNGSQQWGTMFGGDGGFCASDPTDANTFYGEYIYLNITRSSDAGGTAEYISGQFWNGQQWTFKPVPFQIPDAASQSALFIAPFVIDPNDPARLLGGGLSLWLTTDAKTPNTSTSGPSWTSIKNSSGGKISAIAITPGNSDVIWVGHEDGQVYKTLNGMAASPVWQQVDNVGANPLNPGRYCMRIVIDPAAPDTVYATFGGYVQGNVWKTTDGGANWNMLGGNTLPSAPIRALAIHPQSSLWLYLGTEVGLYASEDGGTIWSATNEGPNNCSVDDLFWMNRTLVAVTHGRGMFSIDLTIASV
jgi:hypothetical protein